MLFWFFFEKYVQNVVYIDHILLLPALNLEKVIKKIKIWFTKQVHLRKISV